MLPLKTYTCSLLSAVFCCVPAWPESLLDARTQSLTLGPDAPEAGDLHLVVGGVSPTGRHG